MGFFKDNCKVLEFLYSEEERLGHAEVCKKPLPAYWMAIGLEMFHSPSAGCFPANKLQGALVLPAQAQGEPRRCVGHSRVLDGQRLSSENAPREPCPPLIADARAGHRREMFLRSVRLPRDSRTYLHVSARHLKFVIGFLLVIPSIITSEKWAASVLFRMFIGTRWCLDGIAALKNL